MEKFRKGLAFLYKHSPLVFLVVGVLCIALNNIIYSVFPYIFSGLMIGVGVIGVVLDFIHIIKRRFTSMVFSFSFLLITLGIVFLFLDPSIRMGVMGVTWGLIGIIKSGLQFSAGLEQAVHKSRWCIASFIQAIFTVGVSILLIINPVDSIHYHIIIFGAELIAVSLATFGGMKDDVSLWYFLEVKEKCACERNCTNKSLENLEDDIAKQ